MKILVCIKQVPDTVEVKIDPKTGTLIRDGVPSIINHDDKTGIEAALRIKEQLGGTVTVVSMGPPQADVCSERSTGYGFVMMLTWYPQENSVVPIHMLHPASLQQR